MPLIFPEAPVPPGEEAHPSLPKQFLAPEVWKWLFITVKTMAAALAIGVVGLLLLAGAAPGDNVPLLIATLGVLTGVVGIYSWEWTEEAPYLYPPPQEPPEELSALDRALGF